MQRAHEEGTLVLLENLDPSYTSSEVEVYVCQSSNSIFVVLMFEFAKLIAFQTWIYGYLLKKFS